jgi:hypothetical protein
LFIVSYRNIDNFIEHEFTKGYEGYWESTGEYGRLYLRDKNRGTRAETRLFESFRWKENPKGIIHVWSREINDFSFPENVIETRNEEVIISTHLSKNGKTLHWNGKTYKRGLLY